MHKNFFFVTTRYFLTASFVSAPIAALGTSTPAIVQNQDNIGSYTMNFRNIAVLEYIRFVSKITGVNFIYNEQDLLFPVTILSEEPVSKKNIMSALIQVLQINGLTVSEQANSLLITRTKEASQIAQIVTQSSQPTNENISIITRIFRLKNANIATVAPVVKELLSKSSVIEALVESKQLIITDTVANIDKISQLLETLDTPDYPMDILSYNIKNVASEDLADTLQKIIEPFRDNNVFITIPKEEKNLLLIISTPYLLEKANQALSKIDIPNVDSPVSKGAKDVYIYKPLSRSATDLQADLFEIAADLLADGPAATPLINMMNNAKVPAESNTLIFIGSDSVWEKLQELLIKIDSPGLVKDNSSFWIYKIEQGNAEKIQEALIDTAQNIKKTNAPDPEQLVEAIGSMHYIPSTHSLIFNGTPAAIAKLQTMLSTLDTNNVAESNLWIYQIKYVDEQTIQQALLDTAENIEKSHSSDSDHLIEAIDSMQYVPTTRSLVFNGSPQAIEKIKELLATIDSDKSSSTYWIYRIQNESPQNIQNALMETADNIERSKSPDPERLVEAIDSMHYVASTNSLVFNGTAGALAKLKEMMPNIDVKKTTNNVLIYKPKNVSKDILERSLEQIVESLDPSDHESIPLAQTLRNAQWMPDTSSFIFHGNALTLTKVKELMQDIDTAEEAQAVSSNTFHLYKLQYASGSTVEDQLRTMAEKLPNDTPQAKAVVESLQDIKWIPENNSLLISGTPATIDKVIKLVEKFDVTPGTTVGSKDTFFIYTPQVKSAEVIQAALREYADTFEQAGLADPTLISTIDSSRIAPSSNQLIFTGNSDTLEKVKDLLTTIDIADQQSASIHNVGEVSFFVYPLHNVSAQQFMDLMHNFEMNLQKNGALDEALERTINSMQWIKDTNSMMFIGPSDALDKVSSIAARIDVAGTSVNTDTSTYEVYNPHYEPGDQIIDDLCEFAQNLAQSGVQDSALFDAINNIRWIEKSNTMIISGPPEVITKVKDLIARFDVPNLGQEDVAKLSEGGFLVYKLQYHAGEAIQSALKKMAPTFAANGPTPNPPLAAAIESLQWIQATNSLLVSGEGEILEKVKGLISQVDVPVRQVFIEVLVIETDVNNTQNFGLQWGGNAKYLDKFALTTGNFAGQNALSQSTSSPTFFGPLSGVNATNTPTPQTITGTASPYNLQTPSFDLGVIGDIIMHKGKSFLSLGSLVNALQTDNDSAIIMNPKIITQDNNNSTIFIGQNIPYVGSVVNNQGNNTVNTSNLEYRNVGTNLSITPTLGNDDIITMDITYTMSAQTNNTVSTGSSGINGVQTNQTNMTTRVIVPDQHFVVLSGMMQDSKTYYKSGLPCLGGLPLIGLAFSENDRINSKSNVIIFIRPRIIHTFDEYKQITENQEDLYRDQAGTRSNKENFDNGLNWVKTPENE